MAQKTGAIRLLITILLLCLSRSKTSGLKKLSGLTLKDIRLTVFLNGQKQKNFGKKEGKLLFTHFGVSGPTVLNMSQDIGELLEGGRNYYRLGFISQT